MRVGTLTIIARSGRRKRLAKIRIDTELVRGDIELLHRHLVRLTAPFSVAIILPLVML